MVLFIFISLPLGYIINGVLLDFTNIYNKAIINKIVTLVETLIFTMNDTNLLEGN